MRKSVLALSMIVIVFAGCDPVSERDCGVFDHPALSQWQANTAQAQVQFMNSEGTVRNFTRQAVVLNLPFLGSDGSSNDEDVICELSAEIRLQATDDSLAIVSSYLQREQFLLSSADEALFVDHRIEAPVGTELAGGYLADISIDRTRLNINPARVVYLEDDQSTEVIGGQAYEDVVRIDAIELAPANAAEPAASASVIQQIVLAREFGIVAFTDADGVEFVRVPMQ